MAGLMYLGSCHPITVINDSPLALLGASYQFFSLGLQFEGEPEKIYIKRRVIWDDWTSSYSTNHMNPLPLPIQLLGSTCFNIAQFLSLVDHATCMRNQDPQNFPDDFSTNFLVANLSSQKNWIGWKSWKFPVKTSDHRTPGTSLRKESAKEMVRDWQRKLRSEVRGVDRSIRWIRPVSSGMFGGGIPVWEGHGRRDPKSGPLVGEVWVVPDSWMRIFWEDA